MGTARGKLGNVVLSRVNGVQIARAYNPEVANPKTWGQATQRAIFATVAHMAALLSAIITNSFDNFKNGQRDRNAFSSENVKQLMNIYKTQGQAAVALNVKSDGTPAPNAYILSKGRLGKVELSLVNNGSAFGFAGSQAGATISLGELTELYPAIVPGCQLTFVAILGKAGDPSTFRVRYSRFVISPDADANTIIFDCTNQVVPVTAIVSSKTQGFGVDADGNLKLSADLSQPVMLSTDDGEGFLMFGTDTDETNIGYALAGGMIVSAYNDTKGDWEHSTSIMRVCDNGFMWGSTDGDAIPSYQSARRSATNSDWYTEQSDSGNGSAGAPVYNTIAEAIQGTVKCLGYEDKALKFDNTNTFGPVAEGKYVYIQLTPNAGATIQQNTMKCLVGDMESDNVLIQRNDTGSYRIRFEVPQGDVASYQLNITFKVDYGQGPVTAAIRETISVVQG